MSNRRKKKSGPAKPRPAQKASAGRVAAPAAKPADAARPVAAAKTGDGAAAKPSASPGKAAAGKAAAAGTVRDRRWVSWAVAALAYAGFVVSAYLTLVHYRGYVSPCYVVQGCEAVQTSKYSVVLGVPVALAGAVYFGLLFYFAVGLLRGRAVWLVRAFKVLSFLGALAIIPLFLLQAIVLKAFCSYCLATEVLMLAIWILSFLLSAAPGRSGEPLEPGADTAEAAGA